MAFGLAFWVWFFSAQPYDLPERIVGAAPHTFLDYMLDGWPGIADPFPEEVRAEYARTFRDPKTLHAICEEYRAATTLYYQHDEADRGRRRITCPALVLWSRQGALQAVV
jgi:haloacetate dehalogenase